MAGIQEARTERLTHIESSATDDIRAEFRRDRDRILYCSALRRLSGITQVVSPTGSHPTHNRLTHSLEVAQISRSIAEKLHLAHLEPDVFEAAGGLDSDVVEAAALAHDLGHPPFGHVSESTLNHLLDTYQFKQNTTATFREGFEGNAQSFRIVTRLATRYHETPGLNLTRATLSAMSKYPWLRSATGGHASKWGAYDSEKELLEWSRAHLPESLRNQKTLEAQIMDYADDVAYAVHDLEDFFRAGLIPLDKLRDNQSERERLLGAFVTREPDIDRTAFGEVLDKVTGFLPSAPYDGRKQSKARLRNMTSSLVSRYISAFEYVSESATSRVPETVEIELAILKWMTRYYVIESRALLTTRHGHSQIITTLFRMLSEAADSSDVRSIAILPDFFVEQLEETDASDTAVARIVADVIASLTEAQTVSLFQRLTGQSLGAVLDPIL